MQYVLLRRAILAIRIIGQVDFVLTPSVADYARFDDVIPSRIFVHEIHVIVIRYDSSIKIGSNFHDEPVIVAGGLLALEIFAWRQKDLLLTHQFF